VSERYDLPFHAFSKETQVPMYGIVFDPHSRIDAQELPHFRGSHMIRDPRDIVVSGYFYHLWAEERWIHRPQEKCSGRTYQEHLRRLDQEEGLLAEMGRCRSLFRRMRSWDYQNPHFYEIKYEDMTANEDRILAELFSSYGFHEKAVSTAVKLGRRCSFRALTRREIGQVRPGTVMRSGKVGQWREVFSTRVNQEFKRNTGDLLVHLGYETDDGW
jgi:hypothetical protein